MTEEIRTETGTVAAPVSNPHSQHVDKFAARRAEIKKHKRKAHRRKINASNRPG